MRKQSRYNPNNSKKCLRGYLNSTQFKALKSAIITTVIATLISTFLLSIISENHREKREEAALINSINHVYIGSSKDWLDMKLGPATFMNTHADFLECVYVSDIAAVRVFYDMETASCSAYFVTALHRDKAELLHLPDTYAYITNGLPLGEFSYYDIHGKPERVSGYVSQGDARSFYKENYYYGAGNYYEYYFLSLDYGVECSEESIECMFELADKLSYVDDEVNANQYGDNAFLVLSDRKRGYPNTYGVSTSESNTRINELIADYYSFDSSQICPNT